MAVSRRQPMALGALSILLGFSCVIAAAQGGAGQGQGGSSLRRTSAGGGGSNGTMGAHPGGAAVQNPGPKPVYADPTPALTIDALKNVRIPNTTIDAVQQMANGLQVTASVTHPPAPDKVVVWIGLPAQWNGRFQGAGGSGWSGGSASSLLAPLSQGYAAGATDTGNPKGDGSFALGPDGKPNLQAILDHAYQGIHDMTLVGKALTAAYYGKPPKYAYFVGSSAGGRQALSEAQRFPEDYDGILADSPAIHWDGAVATLWRQVVMNETGDPISREKLRAARKAFIATCDESDGVKDGIVDDPASCTFDPRTLIGTDVGNEKFTAADAEVVRRLWEGPRAKDGSFIWYGPNKDADLATFASPFGDGVDWVRYFLVKDPTWDGKKIDLAEFEKLLHQGRQEWGAVYATDNPDLTKFRDHGGKLFIVQGNADQLIPTAGTIDYYKHVMDKMGGRDKTIQFARLFLTPGAGHGTNDFVDDNGRYDGGLNALVNWVERGNVPEKLDIRERTPTLDRTRPVFPYPEGTKSNDSASTNDRANSKSLTPSQ